MAGASQTPGPEQAVEQMREATEKLREQAWMVAPLTKTVEPVETDDADAPS
jgi:hypothetical protein